MPLNWLRSFVQASDVALKIPSKMLTESSSSHLHCLLEKTKQWTYKEFSLLKLREESDPITQTHIFMLGLCVCVNGTSKNYRFYWPWSFAHLSLVMLTNRIEMNEFRWFLVFFLFVRKRLVMFIDIFNDHLLFDLFSFFIFEKVLTLKHL